MAHGSLCRLCSDGASREPAKLNTKTARPGSPFNGPIPKFTGGQTLVPLTAMRLARSKRLIGFAGTLRA
jgi:hypothetical protein